MRRYSVSLSSFINLLSFCLRLLPAVEGLVYSAVSTVIETDSGFLVVCCYCSALSIALISAGFFTSIYSIHYSSSSSESTRFGLRAELI